MRGAVRFLSSGPNLLGLILVTLFVVAAVAAPVLAPVEDQIDAPEAFRRVGRPVERIPEPPSADARLGTLPGQWDVFYTLVWGTQTALRFGLTAALGAAALGTLVGLLSGYAGGLLYRLTMTVVDGFLTFPALAGYVLVEHVMGALMSSAGAPVFAFVVGRLELDPLVLTLILFSWMPYARIISANALRLKQVEYVQAAKALGATGMHVVFHHILPNVIAPAIVLAARDVGGMVILSAAFTFIGVGQSSPWGALIVMGRDWIIGPGGNPFTYWWIYLPPTIALLLFGVGWNLMGDGMADLLLTHRTNGVVIEGTARRRGRSLAVPVSAAALGIFLGILFAWWARPAHPSGLTPEALREEQRAEYLRMSIELFGRDLDLDKAMSRYQSLGRHAEDTLDQMRRLTANPSQRYVRQFMMAADAVAELYPVQTTQAPPSWFRLAFAVMPVVALVIFILAAPSAVQELARRPRNVRGVEAVLPAAESPRLRRF